MKTKLNKAFMFRMLLKTLFTAGLLFSCTNAVNEIPSADKGLSENSRYVVVKGTADFGNAVPKEIAEILKASAYQNNDISRSAGMESPFRTEYSGTATASDGSTSDVVFNENTFSVTLEIDKTWTITINADLYDSEDVKYASLSSSETRTLSSVESVFNKTFILSPKQNGNGTINLPVVCSPVVKALRLTCISENKDKWNAANISSELTFSGENNIGNISTPAGGSISSGAYIVVLDFLSEKNIVLYSTEQTVNVYDDTETDWWFDEGGQPFIRENGKLEIGPVDLKFQIPLKIYVDASGNQNASGLWTDPVNSVSRACDIVQEYSRVSDALSLPKREYEIIVKSNISGDSGINVSCSNDLKLKIHSDMDEKRNISCGQSESSVFLFNGNSNNLNVTLENISVSNNMTNGIILNNTSLTLINCDICNNIISSKVSEMNQGAGVYCYDNSIITVRGKNKISGNKWVSGGKEISSNLYLGKKDEDSLLTLKVYDDISDSIIGITTELKPEDFESNKIAVTSGYNFGGKNMKLPGNIFTSDEEYSVDAGSTIELANEAVFAYEGGAIKVSESGNLKVEIDESITEGTIDFKVINPASATGLDITSDCNFDYILSIHGEYIAPSADGKTYYTSSSNRFSKGDDLKSGTYSLIVTVTSNTDPSLYGQTEFIFIYNVTE